MKVKLLSLVLLIASWSMVSQETEEDLDKRVYVFKTYKDYVSQNSEYVGDYESYYKGGHGSNVLHVLFNGKKKKINVNKLWGYSINQRLFRIKRITPRTSAMLLKSKEVQLYVVGDFYLNYLIHFSSLSINVKHSVYYSDSLNGQIRRINRMPKHHKDTKSLSTLVSCVEKAKKRYGDQAKLNSYMKCIEKY